MNESIILGIVLSSYLASTLLTLALPTEYLQKLFLRGETLGIVYVMKVTLLLVFYPLIVLGLILYICITAIPPTIQWLFSRPSDNNG